MVLHVQCQVTMRSCSCLLFDIFNCGAVLHNFVRALYMLTLSPTFIMSKRKQAILGFTKKLTHRGNEVVVDIPKTVQDETEKRIKCLHCDEKFLNQQGLSVHIMCKHPR